MTRPRRIKVRTSSAEETKRLGRLLGGGLKIGDVVLFAAELGAGKTTFVQGVVSRWGIHREALSPTFILAETIPARVPIHHLDFYRLSKKEVLSAGLDDYLAGGGVIPKGVVLIEWADRCPEIWPVDYLLVKIKISNKKGEREIELIPHGPRAEKILGLLRDSMRVR